jgi:NADH dehydrogenase FAD-containing subunit
MQFFTPLLSSTAVGTTEFRSIVEPIRHANPLIEFYEGYAIDVDLDRQIVRCRSGQREGYPLPGCDDFDLPYDTLVVSSSLKQVFTGISTFVRHLL